MSGRPFASTDETADRKSTLQQIGQGFYVYAAEGDPNSGVIVGDDAVLVVDAQPTPALAAELIAQVAKVTDKPIRYVLLSHHHASRTLGAPSFKGAEILASNATCGLIAERGKADIESEMARFPRLYREVEAAPAPIWPTLTFPDEISVWLGRREVRIVHIGRGHTAGDVIAIVPDAGAVFAGDLVEHQMAPYCGDAHFTDWPATLDHLAEMQANIIGPGRGPVLATPQAAAQAIEQTAGFIDTLYGSVQKSVAKGRSLKDAFDFVRLAMDPTFRTLGLYEHRLPFSVARAYEEARGVERPAIWTAERDREIWTALQG